MVLHMFASVNRLVATGLTHPTFDQAHQAVHFDDLDTAVVKVLVCAAQVSTLIDYRRTIASI